MLRYIATELMVAYDRVAPYCSSTIPCHRQPISPVILLFEVADRDETGSAAYGKLVLWRGKKSSKLKINSDSVDRGILHHLSVTT